MRKATYRSILAQCPVSQVGKLITQVVAEISGAQVKGPSKSSAANMTHELSVLSSLQTVECLLMCRVATIRWDATTEAGHHINEIHLTLSDKSAHTISIDRLPGGRADDYKTHTIRVINDMCQTYSEYSGLDYGHVRGRVLSKIISCLTDRAAVNHATCRLLNAQLGLELLELNCNLHVLDGFANKVIYFYYST